VNGCRARGRHALQQPRAVLRRGAKFARKLEQRAAQRCGDAHKDAQALDAFRFAEQLVQLGVGIDDEIAHAIFARGYARGARNAHRRHEVANHVLVALVDVFDFAQRRRVEMADAGRVNLVHDMGRRVRLHGIHCGAGERV